MSSRYSGEGAVLAARNAQGPHGRFPASPGAPATHGAARCGRSCPGLIAPVDIATALTKVIGSVQGPLECSFEFLVLVTS